MPSPFPGMDPYLERPGSWQNVHVTLISALRAELQPLVRPRYWVTVEARIYELLPGDDLLVGLPDVTVVPIGKTTAPVSTGGVATSPAVDVVVPLPFSVTERYLEVRDVGTGEVVTVVEVLSPTNKLAGAGRDAYLEKRRQVLSTGTNLVEIDLLRQGQRMPLLQAPSDYHYSVLIASSRKARAKLHHWNVTDAAPVIPFPLREGEESVPLDLGRVLSRAYDEGSYDLALNYRQPPTPPLSPEDEAWADALLREKGLR